MALFLALFFVLFLVGRLADFRVVFFGAFFAVFRLAFFEDFLAAFLADFLVAFLVVFLAALAVDFLATERAGFLGDFRSPSRRADGVGALIRGAAGSPGEGDTGGAAGTGGYSIGSGSIQPDPDQPISI